MLDKVDIVVLNWPRVIKKEEGYERIWNIKFRNPIKFEALAIAEQEMADDENRIEIIDQDSYNAIVIVYTRRWGWEVDLLFYNYKVLVCLNQVIGEIDTVQGQLRDLWTPFRFKWFLSPPWSFDL